MEDATNHRPNWLRNAARANKRDCVKRTADVGLARLMNACTHTHTIVKYCICLDLACDLKL